MPLTLSPATEQLILDTASKLGYDSPEAVVQAALRQLQDRADEPQFAPGELQKLIDEGMRSIETHGTIPLDVVRRDIAELSALHRETVG
jgi:hypothetical protein